MIKKIKVLLLISGTLLLAQEKVGRIGADFLSVELPPQAAGMGGAYVAAIEGVESIFWNISGIANVKTQGLFAGYIPWFVESYIPYFGYVRKAAPYGNIGVFVSGVSSRNFQKATEDEGLMEETFNYNALQIGVSYARYFTDKFALGVALKFVSEDLGGITYTRGAALDAGTIFWTGFRSFRLGMSFVNLGPDLTPSGTYYQYQTNTDEKYSSYPLPVIFRIGGAMEIIDAKNTKLTLSVELDHPTDYYESLRAGLRFFFSPYISLYAGYKYYIGEIDESLAPGGFGAGVSIKYNYFGLSYSFSEMGSLPDVHRFSIFYEL